MSVSEAWQNRFIDRQFTAILSRYERALFLFTLMLKD